MNNLMIQLKLGFINVNVQCLMIQSKIKFEIQNLSFILASLACFYAQFINIDESLNQKHLPCADCFQSIESISTQEIYHYEH